MGLRVRAQGAALSSPGRAAGAPRRRGPPRAPWTLVGVRGLARRVARLGRVGLRRGAGRRRSAGWEAGPEGSGRTTTPRAAARRPDAARGGFSAGVAAALLTGILSLKSAGRWLPPRRVRGRALVGRSREGSGRRREGFRDGGGCVFGGDGEGPRPRLREGGDRELGGSGADADQASRVGGFGDGGLSVRFGALGRPLGASRRFGGAPGGARGAGAGVDVERRRVVFVSGGDDGACKLWDCARLERDVSFRSRLTYASQGGDHRAVRGGDGGRPRRRLRVRPGRRARLARRVRRAEKTGAPVSNGDRGGEDAGAPGDSAGAPQTSSFPPRNRRSRPRWSGTLARRRFGSAPTATARCCVWSASPRTFCASPPRAGDSAGGTSERPARATRSG